MLENIDGLRILRNSFIEMLGKKRLTRIIAIAFLIAIIWCFADLISGGLSVNLWHDLICLVLAVIVERCITWGK